MTSLLIEPVVGLNEIRPGDDIANCIASNCSVRAGDVVVIAQKIVSKAEGRAVQGASARDVARREAKRIVRDTPEALIVETSHGFICANAGVDSSNVEDGLFLRLPKNSDHSAKRIRADLEKRFEAPIAVIIADTFGRPWRLGQTNVAIGCAGIEVMRDHRGETDDFGHILHVTQIAQIDELAAACELVMGKTKRVPVAIVRGYEWALDTNARATDLVRKPATDLFR